jgi:hypothetical protein
MCLLAVVKICDGGKTRGIGVIQDTLVLYFPFLWHLTHDNGHCRKTMYGIGNVFMVVMCEGGKEHLECKILGFLDPFLGCVLQCWSVMPINANQREEKL